MGVVPGKRETKKDRLIKIMRNDFDRKEGYFVIRLGRPTGNAGLHMFIQPTDLKAINKLLDKYNDDLISKRSTKRAIKSALYVDGKHSMDEVIIGLDDNEEYIYMD